MNWFCCQTNPKQEATANHWLRQAGYETLYLHFNGTHRHAGRVSEVILPYFPRYLFFALRGPEGFYGVCTTIGVHSVVGNPGPEEIPPEVIEELRQRGNADGLCVLSQEEKKLRKRLRRDAKVVYRYDAFTEMLGHVILDSGSAVSMWIDGRKWRVPRHTVSPAVAER